MSTSSDFLKYNSKILGTLRGLTFKLIFKQAFEAENKSGNKGDRRQSDQQRYQISLVCEWNFHIYSLVALCVDLFAQAQLSQICSAGVSLFTQQWLFTPKKSKNLLTSWVEFPPKIG